VEKAREQVADLIGARAQEIVFTSSGTEANTWALTGLARAYESKGRHLVVSAVEHLSILQTVRRMEREGWSVSVVPVDRFGQVDPEDLEKHLTPETVLVSVQWANGEVGTIQPIEKLVRRVKARGLLFHTDAVAAVGQIPVDLREIPVDALSLAAHPFGGPPGVGALFVRRGVRIVPLFVGGGQEEGRRAGTENLLGVISMGEAARMARERMPDRMERQATLRDRLIQGILNQIPDGSLNGHPDQRLPGHASFSFPGIDAETLVLALDLEGIAVGLGSACQHETMKPSHVLKAMGVEESRALGTITCTLGVSTTEEEIDQVLELLPRVVARQRKEVLTA
jgi:cysteine desulfurase